MTEKVNTIDLFYINDTELLEEIYNALGELLKQVAIEQPALPSNPVFGTIVAVGVAFIAIYVATIHGFVAIDYALAVAEVAVYFLAVSSHMDLYYR